MAGSSEQATAHEQAAGRTARRHPRADRQPDTRRRAGAVGIPQISADGECTVAKVSHRPPGRGLPVGTEVKTKIGTFTVGAPSKKEGIDSLIKQLLSPKSAPDSKPAR